MKLSGVIITFNEARNIGRCLHSLKDVCDDILVLDSFSSDETEAICRQHGVRFEQNTFVGHIQQKNEALKRAIHPWVLSLDADEALSDTLKQNILAWKSKDQEPMALTVNRLTNYCGTWIKHSGWYPDTKLRLVFKEMAHWGGVNPHDQLIVQPGVPIHQLTGDLLHYSYYSKADHFKQIDYFSNIAANELFAKKIKSSWAKIILKVSAQFIKSYIIKRGYLDGLAGWQIATRSAFATYRKYSMLRKLWKDA